MAALRALYVAAILVGLSGAAADRYPADDSPDAREHAAALKESYYESLQLYANRTELTRAAFEEGVGRFAFLDPVSVLRTVRGVGALDLSREALLDVGGGGHTPTWLRAFVEKGARVLAFDASGAKNLIKLVAASGGVPRLFNAHGVRQRVGRAAPGGGQAAPPDVSVVIEPVTPSNINTRLTQHGFGQLTQGGPPSGKEGRPARPMTALKIDIDSIDCEVMHAVLSGGHRPELIIIETNPAYPPPVLFNLKYGAHAHKWFHAGGAHHILFGCSLSHAVAVARQHGYALLQFVVEDAFFVKQSELHKFGGVTPERKSPAAAFAIGNPFTYYFDPGLFKRRRGGGAAGSFPRGVSEDWARRGRGGVGAAGSVAPLTQYQRDELKSYVLGNVSAIGQRLFGMGAEQLAEVVSVGIDQEAWLG